jgi:hypothetical protein
LAHLEGLTSLLSLNLTGTRVSDAGLKHLNALARLDDLYLYRTKVTNAGIEELHKALPHVTIDGGLIELEKP